MKTQHRLIEEISRIDLLSRGKLCVVATAKSGRKFYSLQYRRRNRHFVRYIASDEIEAYEKATANFSRLRDLFELYVDEMTEKAIREIGKEAGRCKSRKS